MVGTAAAKHTVTTAKANRRLTRLIRCDRARAAARRAANSADEIKPSSPAPVDPLLGTVAVAEAR